MNDECPYCGTNYATMAELRQQDKQGREELADLRSKLADLFKVAGQVRDERDAYCEAIQEVIDEERERLLAKLRRPPVTPAEVDRSSSPCRTCARIREGCFPPADRVCERWGPNMGGKMNVKMIVEEWLGQGKFDGLCNLDVPCGCLCGDLAPCGEIHEDCRPGHREDVDEHTSCKCDEQGTKHWHVCPEGPPIDPWKKHFDEAPEWLCDCGERCVPTAAQWRWNGRDWEHNHGYPLGHVTATRSPNNSITGGVTVP